MFASTLFADENDVQDFDRQIQNLLRIGQADEAASILETALSELGRARHPVATLCLACPVVSIGIVGWDALAERIAALDASETPITALGIDISWPGHTRRDPDADGCLAPQLETNYYNDTAFPFTTAGRAKLLEGYGPYGAEWQGGMTDLDNLLGVRGLEHVYGMVFPLTQSVTASPGPDPQDADAMRLGAAFTAVRLHQAVARAIQLHGLPRPLAVIVGSNESYPFYDAPVVSAAESQEFVRAPIRAVSVEPPLAEGVAIDLAPPRPETMPDTTLDGEPQADDCVVQLSGASLRQRLGEQHAAEHPAPQPLAAAGGLLRRLFARQV